MLPKRSWSWHRPRADMLGMCAPPRQLLYFRQSRQLPAEECILCPPRMLCQRAPPDTFVAREQGTAATVLVFASPLPAGMCTRRLPCMGFIASMLFRLASPVSGPFDSGGLPMQA